MMELLLYMGAIYISGVFMSSVVMFWVIVAGRMDLRTHKETLLFAAAMSWMGLFVILAVSVFEIVSLLFKTRRQR